MTTAAATLPELDRRPPQADPRGGQRALNGRYPLNQLGRIAADGSLLDMNHWGQCAASRAWLDPNCEARRCWREDRFSFLPIGVWMACQKHPHPRIWPRPVKDHFPLEGVELEAAQSEAWFRVAPRRGVPPLYAFMKFTRTPAIDEARRYLETGSAQAMVLSGGVGIGKTTAVRWLERELVLEDLASENTNHAVAVFAFPELSKRLLSDELRDATMKALREADELLLDDVGSGYVKRDGFVVSCFEEMIIYREAEQLPLFMTTNMTPAQFKTMFGPRVYARIRGEWGQWVELSGSSLRRKKAR